MPFIAIDKSTQKRVDIRKYQRNPAADFSPRSMRCEIPGCERDLYVRGGGLRSFHFARYPNNGDDLCSGRLGSHPESPEHMALKDHIANAIETQWIEFNPSVEVEVPLVECGRVADVLLTLPNGFRWAHEAQLASITSEELERRTKSYHDAGISVTWWLGKRALTNGHIELLKRRIGFLVVVDFDVNPLGGTGSVDPAGAGALGKHGV